jgi:CrcB protein
MSTYLWIGLGSGIGGMLRYAMTGWSLAQWGDRFPWSTMLINIIGSFVIGFFGTLTEPGGNFSASSNARQFVMTGVLGGFTTFSAFSLHTLTLARRGDFMLAGGNVIGSVALCLIAVWLGHLAAVLLAGRR